MYEFVDIAMGYFSRFTNKEDMKIIVEDFKYLQDYVEFVVGKMCCTFMYCNQ